MKDIKLVSDLIVSFSPTQARVTEERLENFVQGMSGQGQSAAYYNEKRGTTVSKASLDIYLGKKAECLTAIALSEHFGFPSVPVDFGIRYGKNKGWEPDLAYNKIDASLPNVHVKSCSRKTFEYCDDFSWTFQWSDKDGHGGKDKLFKENNQDLVVLVFLESHLSNKATIKAVLPLDVVKEHLKEPVKESLRAIKRCVYYKDLATSFPPKQPQIKIIKKSKTS